MSRTARDLETLFDVIAGPDELEEGVGYKLALPPPRAAALADARILVLTEHPMSPTDASIGDALEALAGALAKAGARVSRAAPNLPDLELTARLYMRLLLATLLARSPEEMYAGTLKAAAGLDPADTSLHAERLRGATSSFRYWVSNHIGRLQIKAGWRAFFREYDALICPAASVPAFPHDHSPDQDARKLMVNGKPTPYLDGLLWPSVATLPGLPATAIPIGRTPEGLPVGAQIIGPWLEDRRPCASPSSSSAKSAASSRRPAGAEGCLLRFPPHAGEGGGFSARPAFRRASWPSPSCASWSSRRATS